MALSLSLGASPLATGAATEARMGHAGLPQHAGLSHASVQISEKVWLSGWELRLVWFVSHASLRSPARSSAAYILAYAMSTDSCQLVPHMVDRQRMCSARATCFGARASIRREPPGFQPQINTCEAPDAARAGRPKPCARSTPQSERGLAARRCHVHVRIIKPLLLAACPTPRLVLVYAAACVPF